MANDNEKNPGNSGDGAVENNISQVLGEGFNQGQTIYFETDKGVEDGWELVGAIPSVGWVKIQKDGRILEIPKETFLALNGGKTASAELKSENSVGKNWAEQETNRVLGSSFKIGQVVKVARSSGAVEEWVLDGAKDNLVYVYNKEKTLSKTISKEDFLKLNSPGDVPFLKAEKDDVEELKIPEDLVWPDRVSWKIKNELGNGFVRGQTVVGKNPDSGQPEAGWSLDNIGPLGVGLRKKIDGAIHVLDISREEFLKLNLPTETFAEKSAAVEPTAPLEKKEKLEEFGGLKEGDLVQWNSGGVYQFEVPKRISRFEKFNNEVYVFVEDQNTGIPFKQVEPELFDTVEEIEQAGAEVSSSERFDEKELVGKTEDEVEKIEEEKAESWFSKGVATFKDKTSKLYNLVAEGTKKYYADRKKEFKDLENPEIPAFLALANEELVKLQGEKTPKEKLGILRGTADIGFRVKEYKSKGMAWILDKLVYDDSENTGKIDSLLQAYRANYKKEAIKAEKDREELRKPGGWIRRGIKSGGGVASLAGNAVLLSRVFSDLAHSGLNPLRHAAAAAMFFGRFGEALKDSNLNELSKETRIQDSEKAAEMAWALYEDARKKSLTGKVEKIELEKAYVQNLPEEILSKFSEDTSPWFANITQSLVKCEIQSSLWWLNKKLSWIESKEVGEAEKEKLKDAVRLKFAKYLKEMEVMVGESGRVDLLAYGSKILEEAGKKAATIMIFETLAEGAIRGGTALFEGLFGDEKDELKETGFVAGAVETTDETEGPVISEEIFENFEVTGVGEGLSLEAVFANALASEGYTIHSDLEESKKASKTIVDLLKKLGPDKIRELGISSGDVNNIQKGDTVDVNKLITAALSQDGLHPKEHLAKIFEEQKIASGLNLNENVLKETVSGSAPVTTSSGVQAPETKEWEKVFDEETYKNQKEAAEKLDKEHLDKMLAEKKEISAEALDKEHLDKMLAEKKEISAEALDKEHLDKIRADASVAKQTSGVTELSPETLNQKHLSEIKAGVDQPVPAAPVAPHIPTAEEIEQAVNAELKETKIAPVTAPAAPVVSAESSVEVKDVSPEDQQLYSKPIKIPVKEDVFAEAPGGVATVSETTPEAGVSKAPVLPIENKFPDTTISKMVEKEMEEGVKEIYQNKFFRHLSANREWLEVKDDNVQTFMTTMKQSAGRSFLTPAMERHLKLHKYLEGLMWETKTSPTSEENIEDFIKRALAEKIKGSNPESVLSLESEVSTSPNPEMPEVKESATATPSPEKVIAVEREVEESSKSVSQAAKTIPSQESNTAAASSMIDAKFQKAIEAEIKDDIKDLYKIRWYDRWGASDWKDAKAQNAGKFIQTVENYRPSGSDPAVAASMENHSRLLKHLRGLISETGLLPKENENVEDFLKRLTEAKIKRLNNVRMLAPENDVPVEVTPVVKMPEASANQIATESPVSMSSPLKEDVFAPAPELWSKPVEVTKTVENVLKQDLENIYKGGAAHQGFASMNWDEMKEDQVTTFLDQTKSLRTSGTENAVIKRSFRLADYIDKLRAETNLEPTSDETIESYVKRAIAKKLQSGETSGDAPETISKGPEVMVEITEEDEKRWLEEARRQIMETSESQKDQPVEIPYEDPVAPAPESDAIKEADRMGLSEELDLMTRGAVEKELAEIYGKKNWLGRMRDDAGIKSPYWNNIKDVDIKRFQQFYDKYGKDTAPITPFKREENEKQYEFYKLLLKLHRDTGVKARPEESVSSYFSRAMKELLAKIHHSERTIQ